MYPDDVVIRTILYTATSSLHALLLGFMMLRRLYRSFPVFFTYTAVVIAHSVVMYWISYLRDLHAATYMTYFLAYWAGNIIEVALSFVIVYRVFSEVFGRYEMLRNTGRVLYLTGTVVLLGFAIVTAATSPGRDAVRVTAAILLLERSVALIRCGLLLLVFAAAACTAVSWRSRVFGIALGLGIWSSVDLLHMAVQANFGISGWLLAWAPLVGYGLAVGIWFAYVALPQPAVATADRLPGTSIGEWNETLTKLVH